ncbi:MAG TPA: TRAP transporter substrate-binding protein [Alphaproteobacteria bacterium]|jgi:TRAP-type mannitol/chloroaromatic compound transport system substrate-binding protein|nr:TRAP transporter substrate-binding protein [Pseudolabrys sp.]HSE77736.1 TRAP transporter substrate-binding protein [Alphaproteobacteria bacterium]
MKRRKLLVGAAATGAAAAASTFPAPAISQGRMEWRMATSWPKNFPGLGTGAENLARNITTMSGGRLTVRVFGAGEIGPALQVFDTVSSGTAEMGHDASYYHLGKNRATAFFTAVPFGFTAGEQTAWLHYGGGQQLWDELYAPFNLKAFICGNTGTQYLGWYRKEMRTAEDYKGLKKRMPGLGGETIKKLGATVVLLPGGEIFAALQSGAVDAAEWVGPYNDLAFGFHQVTKFYYAPGYHEPGPSIQLTINKAKWDALPNDLKGVIQVAAQAGHDDMLAEFNMRSGEALDTLRTKHGVQVRTTPRDLLQALGTAAGEVMAEEYEKADAIGKKIFKSYMKARRQLIAHMRFGEQAYFNARSLAFKYLDNV